jgi:hypothetical protein
VRAAPALLPPEVDLLQYWSGARLFTTGGNPYSDSEMRAQQSPVFPQEGTIRLWNPPVIFPFIAPLAHVDFDTAKLLWFSIGVFVFTSSVVLLLTTYPCHSMKPKVRVGLYLALLSFVPFVEMLSWGQAGWILLVSVIGWWVLFRQRGLTSLSAGILLSMSAIKPHLLAPLYAALFLSSFQLRQFRLILGFAVGVTLCSALSLFVRHDIWSLYLVAMSDPPLHWRTPNLGSLLQGLSGVHSLWMRHAPLGVAFALGTFLFTIPKIRSILSHREAFLYLVPLSLLVSPYGWLYDQVVVLPLFFELAYRAHKQREPCTSLFLCTVGSVLMILCLPPSLGQERGLLPLVVYCFVSLCGLWRLGNGAGIAPVALRDYHEKGS